MTITLIGLDLAKNVFQVHAVDANGLPVLRRRLSRSQVSKFFTKLPPCRVAMEACAGAHYWARKFMEMGHEPVLIPAQFVKPYVKSNKNDVADAEAIAEAASRPTMRYSAIKTVEQQSILALHRARELLVRQKTMLINAIRGLCGEFGCLAAQGAPNIVKLLACIRDEADERIPPLARLALGALADQLDEVKRQTIFLEKQITEWHRGNAASRRLAEIPGIGPITASALVATTGDASSFKSGRQFAAWLGLTLRQYSSGGKERLAGISKRGDGYIRRLLVHGARVVLRWRKARPSTQTPWLQQLMARKHFNVATVAMANKMARVAWVLLARGESYRGARHSPA